MVTRSFLHTSLNSITFSAVFYVGCNSNLRFYFFGKGGFIFFNNGKGVISASVVNKYNLAQFKISTFDTTIQRFKSFFQAFFLIVYRYNYRKCIHNRKFESLKLLRTQVARRVGQFYKVTKKVIIIKFKGFPCRYSIVYGGVQRTEGARLKSLLRAHCATSLDRKSTR